MYFRNRYGNRIDSFPDSDSDYDSRFADSDTYFTEYLLMIFPIRVRNSDIVPVIQPIGKIKAEYALVIVSNFTVECKQQLRIVVLNRQERRGLSYKSCLRRQEVRNLDVRLLSITFGHKINLQIADPPDGYAVASAKKFNAGNIFQHTANIIGTCNNMVSKKINSDDLKAKS